MQSIRRFFKVLLNLSMGTCGRRLSSHIFHFSAKSKSRIASVLRCNTANVLDRNYDEDDGKEKMKKIIKM